MVVPIRLANNTCEGRLAAKRARFSLIATAIGEVSRKVLPAYLMPGIASLVRLKTGPLRLQFANDQSLGRSADDSQNFPIGSVVAAKEFRSR
jgi:hypothetical protein